MSKWKQEVLDDDRADVDRSLVGQFEAKGHNYRADLARFIREVYALPATDTQLAAVEAALRTAELDRKHLLDAAKDHSAR